MQTHKKNAYCMSYHSPASKAIGCESTIRLVAALGSTLFSLNPRIIGVGNSIPASVLVPAIGITAYLLGKKTRKEEFKHKKDSFIKDKSDQLIHTRVINTDDICNVISGTCTACANNNQMTNSNLLISKSDKGSSLKEPPCITSNLSEVQETQSSQAASVTLIQAKRTKKNNKRKKESWYERKEVFLEEKPTQSICTRGINSYNIRNAISVIGAICTAYANNYVKKQPTSSSLLISQLSKDSSLEELPCITSDLVEKQEVQPSQSASVPLIQTKEKETNNDKIIAEEMTYSPKHVSPVIQLMRPQLSYPLLFSEVFCGDDRQKVLQILYDKLQGEFMHCSSSNYFRYLFGGGKGLPSGYKPDENEFINWHAGKSSLQWLVIRLYRPEGQKQVLRGTWKKVEMCFLLNGSEIPLKTMKLETNHITETHKKKIDAILSEIMQNTNKTINAPIQKRSDNVVRIQVQT